MKRFKIFLFFVIFILLPLPFFAQDSFSISGYVKDAESGEDLIGATVYDMKSGKGTTTNVYGFYTLNLPTDSIILIISYLGYNNIEKRIFLKQNLTLNIELPPQDQTLQDVVIEADSYQERINKTQMSVEKITMKEAKEIPAILGEVDIIKVLQLKPGVKSGGEGASGLYVRGGGPDQNLIVLDEATVYNASHLFGFFSVFNSDAVKNVDLYKGDFPAQFGGRLSSVLDVKLNDGNKKRFAGTGGIGVISSRLTLEAPIQKDRSSFIISARRTYFDVFTRIINKAQKDNPDFSPIPNYYFYDLNAKVNYDLGKKDRLFLSGYFGQDRFGFNNGNFNFGFNWGNATGTMRWNHVFNPKLFLNTSLIFSDYKYEINNSISTFNFKLGSSVRDYAVKTDFDYAPNNKHAIKFGVHYTYHQFNVGRLSFSSEDGKLDFNARNDLEASEMGVYVSDDIQLSPLWRINAGLRVSGFESKKKWFYGLEPRLAARFKASENTSIKFAYARMFQYVHLVANSGASLPTDIWYPSNRIVQPQISDQFTAGASTLLWGGKFLLSNEIYYKNMQRQIDFRDGANLFVNPDLDKEFVFGRGWAYGDEIYLEKKSGKLRGWVGYTLSWTWRQFKASNNNPAINDGNPFHPRYDRRHDVSIVVTYDIAPRLTFTTTWVYGTGNAITLPSARFFVQDVGGSDFFTTNVYQARNSFRMAPYHRMDLGLVWKFKPRWGESDLTFSVYNAYNRRNPYFVYFEEIKTGNTVTGYKAKQVTLFPIIPSITYNFKF